ncbi:MAG TPA: hypothetical protein VGH80_12000 [Xanthomonadaceae bacterium]|jgi:hypothetical protein
MRTMATLALALLVGVANASPEQRDHSISEKNDGHAHQKATQKASLVVDVANASPGKLDREASEKTNSQEHEETAQKALLAKSNDVGISKASDDKSNSSTDDRIANYTGKLADYTLWLACLTAIVAAVGVVQIIFLIRSDKTSVRAANAATKAAEIAEKTSDANLAIAKGQFEEMRQARILEHRPKLRVRNIIVNEPSFPKGRRIAGRFIVSNVGGARAHIEACRCDVLWGLRGLPMESPFAGRVENSMQSKPTIAAGAYEEGQFCSDNNYDGNGQAKPHEADPRTDWPWGVYVLGWIDYIDDLAIRRRTVFCRQLENHGGIFRFHPVDDPDYEYED